MHYSPLYDRDTTTSPIDPEGGNNYLEAAVHINEEPAPPYTPQSSDTGEGRSKKLIHITEPTKKLTAKLCIGPGEEGATLTPPVSEAIFSTIVSPSSNAVSNTAQNQPENESSSRACSPPNASVLRVANPVASPFDACFRPHRPVPFLPSQADGKIPVATSRDSTCRPSASNQLESFLSTGSPCATPPPQYTITIHSSHQLTRCDSAGRLASVPDIILSPVPWLPKEHVPQSPPHYLAIPPRRLRSREQHTGIDFTKAWKVDSSKPLPEAPPPSQDEKEAEKGPKPERGLGIRVGDAVPSPRPLRGLALAVESEAPTVPVSKVRKAKQVPRSATYPLPKRVLPPLPPPRPVLPIDLEAVYPTKLEEDETPAKTDRIRSGGEWSDVWSWPNWPASAFPHRRLDRTESGCARESYGTEKGVDRVERGDITRAVQTAIDSEDVPLAQELLMAIKRRKVAFEREFERRRESPVFGMSQVVRKGFIGGLSAFAAKARVAIERELDSDEEDSMGEEEEAIEDIIDRREMEGGGAFVIGEEDCD